MSTDERAQADGRLQAAPGADASSRRLVWDLPLRVFHWSLAIAVAGSFATHWIGTTAFAWHVRCGYATLVLLAFRLAWGVVGPVHARFADFVRGPRATITATFHGRPSPNTAACAISCIRRSPRA